MLKRNLEIPPRFASKNLLPPGICEKLKEFFLSFLFPLAPSCKLLTISTNLFILKVMKTCCSWNMLELIFQLSYINFKETSFLKPWTFFYASSINYNVIWTISSYPWCTWHVHMVVSTYQEELIRVGYFFYELGELILF